MTGVAANGDTANKIGTAGVAILAHNYGIPFYVCAPTATVDLKTSSGGQIEIEARTRLKYIKNGTLNRWLSQMG